MIQAIIGFLFGCTHKRTTFPLTPTRKMRLAGARRGTYVVCIDCGQEFDYSWREMRVDRTDVRPEVLDDNA